MYGGPRGNKFAKQLSLAQGIRRNLQFHCQCMFEVPLLTGLTGPRAQYCWPKALSAESGTMYHPLDAKDWQIIMQQLFTATDPTIYSTFMYEQKFYIEYTARYSIKNNSNMGCRIQAIKLTAKRNVENFLVDKSWSNPFNIAGTYMNRMEDPNITEPEDATNLGLHLERTKFERLPPIRFYFRSKTKTYWVAPGKEIAHTVRFKRWFSFADIMGNLGMLVSIPTTSIYEWVKGQTWVTYKMLSESADYKGGVEPIMTAGSTRTTNVGLLSYLINYKLICPNPTAVPKTVFHGIGASGTILAPVEANIQNIVDSSMNVQIEQDAGPDS